MKYKFLYILFIIFFYLNAEIKVGEVKDILNSKDKDLEGKISNISVSPFNSDLISFEVTEKGANVIKVMILGDDRSIFEEDGANMDYHTALNNTKNIKTAKKQKVASSWWDRFEVNEEKPEEE